MNKTTYFCDKCKKEVPKRADLMQLQIKLETYCSIKNLNSYIDVCHSCAEKIGFIKRIVVDDEIIPETQPVKDKLYEAVVGLIQETGINVEY